MTLDADFKVTEGWEGDVLLHLQPDTAKALAKALRLLNTLRLGKGLSLDSGWEDVARDLETASHPKSRSRR